ncbi:hypothetical protein OKW22_001269 [Bacilli bacterium PM5-3]|nr:hypothetical protein [Bacilli bacterium PM5-3]MDH6604074.1 hypothetical protein [Bacilli bacterium PM5-9]
MPNNYPFKPRGIVKWHAFAALISGEEQKQNATTIKNLEIELLDDKLALLETTINDALKNNSLLAIKYLENNQINYLESTIIKLNSIEQVIEFKDIKLQINQIIDLTII